MLDGPTLFPHLRAGSILSLGKSKTAFAEFLLDTPACKNDADVIGVYVTACKEPSQRYHVSFTGTDKW